MVKATRKATPPSVRAMTEQVRQFCMEYVLDWNGKAAAIRAGFAVKSAAAQACNLLGREDVQELIRAHMQRIENKTTISAARVIQEAWGIATANVNDLVEYRRDCCRYCYGIDYGYQRSVREINEARRQYANAKKKAVAADKNCEASYEEFDEMGGPGWDARRPPCPTCQECWGAGVGNAHFKDTRSLPPEALALYAGVKQTKDGFQMLTIDKLGAMEKLFKHLGLYKMDNDQKADAFKEFIDQVQSKSGKLPIKGG